MYFICCTCQLKKSYSFSLWFCLSKIGTLQLYPIIECTRILDEAMEMLILDVFAGNVTSSSVTSRDILWHTVSYLLKQHCKFLCAMHCKYIACKKRQLFHVFYFPCILNAFLVLKKYSKYVLVFCCIAAWIQPDISGCQQDFLVVWRWNQLRTF